MFELKLPYYVIKKLGRWNSDAALFTTAATQKLTLWRARHAMGCFDDGESNCGGSLPLR